MSHLDIVWPSKGKKKTWCSEQCLKQKKCFEGKYVDNYILIAQFYDHTLHEIIRKTAIFFRMWVIFFTYSVFGKNV